MEMSFFKVGLLVMAGLLAAVVAGVEEHGDPKEHKREGGKSESSNVDKPLGLLLINLLNKFMLNTYKYSISIVYLLLIQDNTYLLTSEEF